MSSNQEVANKRIITVISLIALATIAACFGWYPTNYEQLFTKLNIGIDIYAYICAGIGIALLIPKGKKLPGEKTVSDMSFLHMTVTLGLACAFFSYCADPQFIVNYGSDRNPYSVLGFLYGEWEWLMFIPFILVEVYDLVKGLPKWLARIRMYFMAVSMMLGIGISLMAGCNTIPRIIKAIYGFEISPFLMMVPISCLICISLIRGIHRGMKLFSNITMVMMYVITAVLLIFSITHKTVNVGIDVASETYKNMFSWMHYTGTEIENKFMYPYWLWGLTWAGIIPPFVRKIAEGRSWRSLVLIFTFGTAIVCQIYAGVSASAFSVFEGDGIKFFATYNWVGLLYILMLIMMFVTSADSTCYSLDELISKGVKAPVAYRKLLWIMVMCAFISVLMIVGGGTTDALYGLSYITAPVLLILCFIGLGYMVNDKVKLIKSKSKEISNEK